MLTHAYNPSMLGTKARESGIRDHPQVCGEFEAMLGYMRPCLKTKGEVGGCCRIEYLFNYVKMYFIFVL